MIRISICVCTRKRQEGIKNLLESFEKMHTTSDLDVRIILVENDNENHTEKIINEFLKSGKLKISYFLETKTGLVYARNRSVKEAGDCDFCCFTDDDEIVSEDWLTELLKCQKEFEADGVAGPTYPVFSKDVPLYIKNFHTPKTYPFGTIINNAYTGNLLLRKKYLDKISGPFDERLNFTGGEDIHLTNAISEMGGTIRYNPDAKAYENFPDNRATIKYIIQRTYRNSNTGLYARSLKNIKYFKLKALPRLVLRFCNGLLTVAPLILFGGKNKIKGFVKIVNAIGGFHFILGRRNRFYK